MRLNAPFFSFFYCATPSFGVNKQTQTKIHHDWEFSRNQAQFKDF